jgi:Dyp-type peroxidase family
MCRGGYLPTVRGHGDALGSATECYRKTWGLRREGNVTSAQTVTNPAPIREAAGPLPLEYGPDDPSHPFVPDEPVLALDEIQGNILGGFNKDHQTLLCLRIEDSALFKNWLESIIPFIATSAEVITFNRLFKAMRSRRGTERNTVKATWINIAFSARGLQRLGINVNTFTDAAFRDGLSARSASLGDPTSTTAEGNPASWLVGGTSNEIDVLLIIASDDQDDLHNEVTEIKSHLMGAVKIFEEEGDNLTGDLAGHEHFGFLDGVSQPGIRGRLSSEPNDVLTLRQNPNDRDQGKPGQDLLWPGEFVFGYPGQDPEADEVAEPGPIASGGPDWSVNGSFLVWRRLRQRVYAFHRFLRDTATNLGVPDHVGSSGTRLVGSRLVGRWPSGAPVLRSPDTENTDLGADDCANNNFEFREASDPIPPTGFSSPSDCIDNVFPTSPGDLDGVRCPFTGHIRKTYPRDDQRKASPTPVNEVTTQTHRLLRRGIPFGKQSTSKPEAPTDDGRTRGLHFLAYQTSIVGQFEFVTRTWANNPNFKELFGADTDDPVTRGGHDPIIGQNNTPGENRRREFTVTFKGVGGIEQHKRVSTTSDWVIPTGGGYFFAPSITALGMLATP